MEHIPIFIIVHNRLKILIQSVESYEKYIKTPIKIIFHNVASTYEPTLTYLKKKEREGYTVYHSKENNHHTVVNSIKDYLKKHPECKYYVMTDPDVMLDNVNGDILEYYKYLLNKFKVNSVGPMLRIDDIPDYYPRKKNAISGHSQQFWNKTPKNVLYPSQIVVNQHYMIDGPKSELRWYAYKNHWDLSNNQIISNCDTYLKLKTSNITKLKNKQKIFVEKNTIFSLYKKYKYINCNTDTTFQLCSANNIPNSFPHNNSIRCYAPYSAKHLDWYINPKKISGCQKYYSDTTTSISNWQNPNWKGIYGGQKLGDITSTTLAIKHIHYCVCRCKNGTNFGDMITSYIYKKLTGTNPINSIPPSNTDVVYGVGSILGSVTTNAIVWGSGIMFKNRKFRKPRKILCVRGPITRQACLDQGYECPEIYGDAGLLLPYFYYPEIKKKYKIGLIPHYIDYELCKKMFPEPPEDLLIIDITNNIETVVNDMLSCEMLISSSLHGIIGAHAYNIKCAWTLLSNKIAGKNTKYYDYYESYGMKNMKPCSLSSNTSVSDMVKIVQNYNNPTFPIKTDHILQLCPF